MKSDRILSPVPGDAHQAFTDLAKEIAAVRDDDILHITVDIERAASIALAAAAHMRPLAKALDALPDFDHKTPKRLRSYALAALYAHLVASEAAREDERFGSVLEEATKLREQLLSAAELLAVFGLVSADRVAEIRAGSGHLDTASDLIALGSLFAENWTRLVGKTPVTREQVERAGGLGTEMHELVASRKFAGPPGLDADDPQRTRSRAFTLLVMKYDECRRGVSYLRWKYGDADVFAPSIYTKARRRQSTSANDEMPQTDTPATTVPAGVPPTPIGAPVV